jgi:hypothetical protein
MLSTILKHAALPTIAPAAIVGLYFTPVLLFGCVNRGLLALAIVFLSAAAAFVTIGIGFRERARGRSSARWLVSAVILATPLVLILGPLG